eukprot:CAMPEP_0202905144 /NCGR_PEP_ID=MMETSP1392-20130828/32793_1 /ASSEMBLY_ACC=CAM_ASM_000868 /TAXON_ID=225041 /ORGANISM="Chlamydomonas chlamydogama, Strain SAG 11-48b" /LENGTH=75 /DNA_ID=CAMNT_0049593109 /DNA_START=51 /DNA_END=275 /DNA_ORIENTATION=-
MSKTALDGIGAQLGQRSCFGRPQLPPRPRKCSVKAQAGEQVVDAAPVAKTVKQSSLVDALPGPIKGLLKPLDDIA